MIYYRFGDKQNAKAIKKTFEHALGRELNDETLWRQLQDPGYLFFMDEDNDELKLRKTNDKFLIRLITKEAGSEELELLKITEFTVGQTIRHIDSGDEYRVDSVTDKGYMISDRNGQQSYLMRDSAQCEKFTTSERKIEPLFNADKMLFDDCNNVYYIEKVDTDNQKYRVTRFKAGSVFNILDAVTEEIPFSVMHSKKFKI